MDILGFYFSYVLIVLVGILLLALSIQLYYYFRYFRGIIRYTKRVKKGDVEFLNEKPAISVIIASKNEEENLRQFLPFILEQDYPNFEVIVVNDASEDATEDVLTYLKDKYPNLRSSFVPKGAKNLSTKKLALMLGIKASENDILLFTDADCMPDGKDWISNIVRNFTEGTDYVLGYGGYLDKKGFLNKLIKFDTLFVAIQYLGMAIAKRPYMGVGRNLAYRKEAFYQMKGFSSILQFRSGDDDLLINKASNKFNTRVEISQAGSTWSVPSENFKQWYKQKERHLSVSGSYSRSSKVRLFWEPFSRAIFYLCFIAITVFSIIQFNWITLGLGLLFFIGRLILQIQTINKSAKILGERKFYFTVLIFDILLPIITLNLLIFGKKGHKINWK